MSRVGKKIIPLPKGVELKMTGRTVTAKGPKGELSCEVTGGIDLEVTENGAVVRQASAEKTAGAFHGLNRALIANLVEGVSTGFSKTLEIHGTGYRAQVQGNKLVLNLGFSQPVEYAIPQGIQAAVDGNKIVISGIEKSKVGQVAAEIRRFRPPEPYKGKGVRYQGEHVRRKAGKSAGA